MKFERVSPKETEGTFLVGEIYCSYQYLVEILGEPEEGTDKTDAEWLIRFEDGTVATIYNWKNGPSYTGVGSVEDIREWNVGGHSKNAFFLVQKLMDL